MQYCIVVIDLSGEPSVVGPFETMEKAVGHMATKMEFRNTRSVWPCMIIPPQDTPEPEVDEGIFWHKCEEDGCHHLVQFDDEPYCFTHSPDSGSSVKGYSARAIALNTD